jgi:signal transduction histidine kinase
MRWPLRTQILFPMACLMLATLVATSVLNAWFAGRQAIDRIQSQLRDIGETLASTSFPLTDSVLKNMRGLSGAEFVVVGRSGQISASSRSDWLAMPLPAGLQEDQGEDFRFDQRATIGGNSYFCAALALRRPFAVRQGAVLHVLYPVASYQRAWWEAVWPPAVVGLAGLLMMGVLSFAIASRVTRPIHQLCEQVDRIARGQFVPMATPPRDDEVRDLSLAVNRMAEMLSGYETEVRRNERLRTLGRLGGGIAHQMRNAATGCRLALDLHRRGCPAGEDESLAVACQQLDVMQDYLERFLSLGKFQSGPPVPVDLTEVVERVLPLVQPKARHLGVDLSWTPPDRHPRVLGNADGLAQVMVNLLLNAIEAAAARGVSGTVGQRDQHVSIRIEPSSAGRVQIHVLDTGAGPAEHVRETLFEALISEKPDGVGLGLFLAREVVSQHGGTIAWTRRDEMTCFTVELPAVSPE